MNIAIWIAIALVCFVLPSGALTSGGRKNPSSGKLAEYARSVGLPIPDQAKQSVIDRLKRRQRGTVIGGVTGIIVATILAILFFDNEQTTWAAPLVVLFAGAGTGFGGAWAIAAHRPDPSSEQPTVARMRSVGLRDYLTNAERFGLWIAPATVILGAAGGVLLLIQLPATEGLGRIGVGLTGAGLALIAWVASVISLQRVLAAPARSSSDLELAWDDAERASGLRQVAGVAIMLACFSILFWIVFIAEGLTSDGFYREHFAESATLTILTAASLGALIIVTAAGPVVSWITGSRKGYEQRMLWPNGVTQ